MVLSVELLHCRERALHHACHCLLCVGTESSEQTDSTLREELTSGPADAFPRPSDPPVSWLVAEIARRSGKQCTFVEIGSCRGESNVVEAKGLEPAKLLTARPLELVRSHNVP